jgi:hypothetical protein
LLEIQRAYLRKSWTTFRSDVAALLSWLSWPSRMRPADEHRYWRWYPFTLHGKLLDDFRQLVTKPALSCQRDFIRRYLLLLSASSLVVFLLLANSKHLPSNIGPMITFELFFFVVSAGFLLSEYIMGEDDVTRLIALNVLVLGAPLFPERTHVAVNTLMIVSPVTIVSAAHLYWRARAPTPR